MVVIVYNAFAFSNLLCVACPCMHMHEDHVPCMRNMRTGRHPRAWHHHSCYMHGCCNIIGNWFIMCVVITCFFFLACRHECVSFLVSVPFQYSGGLYGMSLVA